MYRVRWGRLLHERFNNTDAEDLFKEALERDPKNAQAYLGLALVSADGFDSKALDYGDKALELDPKLVEAHELMANLALEDSDTERPSSRPTKPSSFPRTRSTPWPSTPRWSCWPTARPTRGSRKSAR